MNENTGTHEDRAASPRRLVRRTDDKVIAGVCSGVAHYFGIDPVIVRIIWVVAAFSGVGVLAYFVAAIIVPDQRKFPGSRSAAPVSVRARDLDTNTLAIIVVAVGVLVLGAGQIGWGRDNDLLLPLALIGAGAWLLLRERPDDEDDDWFPAPPRVGADEPHRPIDDSDRADPADPADPDADDPTPGDPAPGDARSRDPLLVQAEMLRRGDIVDPPSGPSTAPLTGPPTRTTSRRRERSTLGRLTFGALVLGAGVVWVIAVSTGWNPRVETVLALALLVIGGGLLVGAFAGRARWLILPGVLLVGALSLATLVDVPLRGPVGERRFAPQSAAAVAAGSPYRMLAGEMTLDLSALDGDLDLDVEASLAAGEMEVIVPAGAVLTVDVEVGAGEVLIATSMLDHRDDGLSIDIDLDPNGVTRVGPGADSTAERTVLRLTIDIGAGELRIIEAEGALR